MCNFKKMEEIQKIWHESLEMQWQLCFNVIILINTVFKFKLNFILKLTQILMLQKTWKKSKNLIAQS